MRETYYNDFRSYDPFLPPILDTCFMKAMYDIELRVTTTPLKFIKDNIITYYPNYTKAIIGSYFIDKTKIPIGGNVLYIKLDNNDKIIIHKVIDDVYRGCSAQTLIY